MGLRPCLHLSCVCPCLCCVPSVWLFSPCTLPPLSPPWEQVCCVELGALCGSPGEQEDLTGCPCSPQINPCPRALGCTAHLGHHVL